MLLKDKHIIGIIPARYSSTRLPGKPLVDIKGKTLIHRVFDGASKSKLLNRIIIATDDERIADECWNIGAEFILTPSDLPSGTDRVLSAYNQIDEKADLIINIQGDEPLIDGDVIDTLIKGMIEKNARVGTLIKEIDDPEELDDYSVVKVVLNKKNQAMYFSRHPIPFIRDNPNKSNWLDYNQFWKHIGIYAYTPKLLESFIETPEPQIEKSEKLEQLRILYHCQSIYCIQTDANLISVDTSEDLEKVKQRICD